MSKTVLVTGALSGIGAASVEALSLDRLTDHDFDALMRMFVREEMSS